MQNECRLQLSEIQFSANKTHHRLNIQWSRKIPFTTKCRAILNSGRSDRRTNSATKRTLLLVYTPVNAFIWNSVVKEYVIKFSHLSNWNRERQTTTLICTVIRNLPRRILVLDLEIALFFYNPLIKPYSMHTLVFSSHLLI